MLLEDGELDDWQEREATSVYEVHGVPSRWSESQLLDRLRQDGWDPPSGGGERGGLGAAAGILVMRVSKSLGTGRALGSLRSLGCLPSPRPLGAGAWGGTSPTPV